MAEGNSLLNEYLTKSSELLDNLAEKIKESIDEKVLFK